MAAGSEWQIHAAIARALFLVVSLLCCDMASAADEQQSAAEMMEDLMYGRGTVGGPFTLTDQNGQKRSDSEFRGKLMIVYFGYTFCPDVCPTDLIAITEALNALGAAAEGVQPVFITVDPERDTPLLKDYVAAFHPSLVGLAGSPEAIRKVANSYKAYYRKVPGGQQGEYSIDHTGIIYLMGRDGEYLGFLPPQTDPGKLTEVLRKHLAK
ncbi:MAG TPA: SCO family protein [Bradyrhizobium sp.]|jgi:cytochrome oxidase Cu insertion factor (SCO1/SenC/PrrC family)|uniref:SCO family protein n=1 Tax=Bradyrhizobium sp. TaxID=376 RepID=UPI002C0736C7|nr:SCO family protein [Bradyrhizobium sp.]HTC96509.1 SCO family protein [Bradyrhizobium sp.]HXB80553.1 SCO family protein [Bradyrhizobium sp.]